MTEEGLKTLRGWNELTREVKCPPEIQAALMTNRPEILRAYKPKNFGENDYKMLLDLIATLMETNSALQQHSAQIAQRIEGYAGTISGTLNALQKLKKFADFEVSDEVFQRTKDE